MTTITAVKKALRKEANAKKAKVLAGFFKTGPGEYGEGDVFIGVTVPKARAVASRFADAGYDVIEELLGSDVHEERMTGLLLLIARHGRGDADGKREAVAFYLDHLDGVNNWDLVDLSAPKVLGPSLERGSTRLLDRLAASPIMWHRRVAVVATAHLIGKGRFAETLRIAEMLLDDEQDLMHKAVGWMLREVGKRDKAALVRFLRSRYRRMPRTMLRYAIERFPEAERKRYLSGTAQWFPQ